MFTGAAETSGSLPRRDRHGVGDAVGDGRRATPDLRLVPPAVAVWAGAALGASGPPPTGVLLVAGAVVGTVVVAVAVTGVRGGRGRPGGRDDTARAGRWLTTAVVVAFLAAGIVAAGLTARSRAASTLAQLAADGISVEMELVVTDDPRLARSSSTAGPSSAAGPMYVVPARAERVTVRGRVVQERQPVLVLATATGWQPLLPSQRLHASGRLASSRTGDVVAVLLVREPPRDVGSPSVVQRAAAHVRTGLRDACAVLPTTIGGLLPALVVGDTSRLTEQVRADFRAAGMVHLTAVSGSNVAIVVGTAAALARRSRLGRRSRAVWAGSALIGFVVLARPSASVLRAGAMAMIGVVAAGCGRSRQALPALSAAVILLVLVDSDLARSVGFALSVLATAGILVLAPGWSAAWSRRLPPLFAEVAAVAVAAQLACTPVLAWIGGGVSLVAVPANMAAVAAVAPATLLGVLAAVAGTCCDPVAEAFAWLGGLPCRWLVGVASVAARVPGGRVGWPSGAVGALASVAVVAVVAVLASRRRGRRGLAATCVGVLLAEVVLVPAFVPRWPPPGWLLVACDVGQGDALVLAAGDGDAVLVDGGPDPVPLARCLHDLGVERLPAVVVSHLHADHVVGLAAVLGAMPVGTVLVGPSDEPPDQSRRLEALAASAGVPVEPTVLGDRRVVGAVSWEVLGPVSVTPATGPNDASLVLRVVVDGLSMLLTGDAEIPAQGQLLNRFQPAQGYGPGPASDIASDAASRTSSDLAVDVLKVPHHGAREQDAEFLAATGAEVALVSAGTGNTYGHPAPTTLDLLVGLGMTVARTDLNSDVAVIRTSDGRPQLVARRR